MKYIIINEDKVPQHSLDNAYTLEEVKDYPNLAVLVEEPYVVVDIDDMEMATIVYDILEKYKIKSNIMRTSRGFHFWFKSRTVLTNHVHINTPIGVPIDIKSYGKKSLATIKLNDQWREWIIQHDEVDDLPFWLVPIKLKNKFYGMGDGDGRDDALFRYIMPLLSLKFTKTEINIIFKIINEFLFKTPLTQAEINKMFDGNTIFDETIGFFDKHNFLHHEFAEWLRTKYPIFSYGGRLFTYRGGVYVSDTRLLEELMINKIPKLKSSQRAEVLKYLEIKTTECATMLSPENLNCKNGIVDITNKDLKKHDEQYFTINQIPTYYNPGAYSADVDKFLNGISNNDKQIRMLIEEVIGYTLLGDCRFQTSFILLGKGANGKSIFLKMLTNLLGEDNISSLSLEELNSKFKTPELVDKMANLGDDISSEFLSDSSMFKKLVSGERITVERKNQNPFQFNNRAKMIFSANNLPPVSDKSYGLYRRLVIIPFLNKFTEQTEGFDPNILRKIIDDTSKSYLLDLAIAGINRVIKNNRFTTPTTVDDIVENYEMENNSVLQWLQTKPEFLDINVTDVYRDYNFFCTTNHCSPFKKTRFIAEIVDKVSDTDVKNTTRNGKFMQIIVSK